MSEIEAKIAALEARLSSLVRTQIEFQTEVSAIRKELTKLRGDESSRQPRPSPRPVPQSSTEPSLPPEWREKPAAEIQPPITQKLPRDWTVKPSSEYSPPKTQKLPPDPANFGYRDARPEGEKTQSKPDPVTAFINNYTANARANLEKFIGENLISKIGIIVLILGVGIFAKYAIDNGWISPATRIVFGYAFGGALFGLSTFLKRKYLSFSAVLLSGAMAIFYFVTYFAYALYGLLPQPAAFVMMTLFTVFTVSSAIWYNRQVIAHVGLVGAYAVPFLLSNNSGNYLFLFIYMAIINTGVLAISVRKYWKPIFYTASVFTWLIFFVWSVSKYVPAEHFYLALTFLGVFFLIFYVTKIIHGISRAEVKDIENLICIATTALIFYLFCLGFGNIQVGVFDYALFFTYLASFSLALLITSYHIFGRFLVYLSYPLTWIIFGVWFISKYDHNEHFLLASIFAAVFFLIYYAATLIYRLATERLTVPENLYLVITNSFVFYGFGYAILASRPELRGFEGLFTAGHAVLHSAISQFINRIKPAAIDAIQALTILVITFATIAIPIQFDGNYITLIWSVEAAALFWFGRVRGVRLFEWFSYPVMVLAFFSLAIDWFFGFIRRLSEAGQVSELPFLNGDFLTALVLTAAFIFIHLHNRKTKENSVIGKDATNVVSFIIPAIALFALYNSMRLEIDIFFRSKEILLGNEDLLITGDSRIPHQILDLGYFNSIFQIDFTLVFLTILAVVNIRRIKSAVLALSNVTLAIPTLLAFVTLGMLSHYALRETYLAGNSVELFGIPELNIAIRFVSYVCMAGMLGSLYWYSRSGYLSRVTATIIFDAILYPVLLIVSSCELMNIAAQLQLANAEKYGLSILWAAFALMMIVIGIAWNRAHIRIAAIALLGVTLAKLFFFDISDLPTIPKTILFIAVGMLLLVISFLYNKYKALIFKTVSQEPDEEVTVENL